MRLEDWRNLTGPEVSRLYAAERERWRRILYWDSAPSWEIVEQARGRGTLPGYAVLSDADVVGWTFFLLRGGALQIGALTGQRADVVRTLLDAVLAAPEAALARRYQCFVFPECSAVEVALERRRFETERYLYLERLLDRMNAANGPAPASWRHDDFPEVVRLVARAYAGSASARCFAPNVRLDEWTTYLAQLIRSGACGHFSPAESLALRSASGLDAILLATRLDTDTTHVAQVVVDQAARRGGRARALVEASAVVARAAGASRQTLLVSASNAPARALYAQLGFVERATFLFADRDRITRATRRSWPQPIHQAETADGLSI